MLRQEQYWESPEGRGCRPKVMQTWKAKVWSRLHGLVGAWLPLLLANFVQVDYFMRKRIIDKRKELIYAQGPAVQPDRGVGQIVSKWGLEIWQSWTKGCYFRLVGWSNSGNKHRNEGCTRHGEASLFKTITKRRKDIYFLHGFPPVFVVAPYLEGCVI